MRIPGLRGRQEILAEKRDLRRKYKTLYDDLASILHRHDPIHIAITPDEYEPEVGKILARARDASSVQELTDLIHSVFVEMFDEHTAGDPGRYKPIAREFWDVLRASQRGS